MVTVSGALAERVADVVRLLETDEPPLEALRRLTFLGVELVPGTTAAAVTITGGKQPLTFAASDRRIEELHEHQFSSGQGPAAEAMRHNEPRRVDDMTTERRWPGFCQAARNAGFGSCLILPLRTDRQSAGALSLYADRPQAFTGAVHDLAMLFAAQGGTAVHNAAVYRRCRQMVRNLHVALESQAVIEQAKGILHACLDVPPEEAFALLSAMSQNTNRKVRAIASDLVGGQIQPGDFAASTES